MGAPWFQIRHLEQSHGLVALSGNMALYGEISERLMSLAAGLGTATEVYSCDEVFVDLRNVPDATRRAWAIRARIERWIGIPCGVGIGATKTLAKLANHCAKSAERKPGSYPAKLARVCNFAELTESEMRHIFECTPVTDVWGIGKKIGASLVEAGVWNAQLLRELDPGTVRRRWSLTLERTVRELQGLSCIALDDAPSAKQMIACTRTFGHPVQELSPLLEAVSEFAIRASERLRKQDGRAGQVHVFARTSPHRPGLRFNGSIVVPLLRPTADTRLLVEAAMAGMRAIYKPGYELVNAGVVLMDLIGPEIDQGELNFHEPQARDLGPLMTTMDAINARYGKGTLQVASAGQAKAAKEWGARQARRTPRYTTEWSEMPTVRA